jgi:hypothetical protein
MGNRSGVQGSRFKGCGAHYVPPRSICIECYKPELEWVELQGKGKLAAFACISIAPPFMIEQGYNRKNPYCSGVVELEDGGRVDARIEGADCTRPETIKVGMPLKVKFLHRGEGDNRETFLAFEPA